MLRNCSKCKVDKEFGEFNKCSGGKYGLKPICKVCESVINKAWRDNNKEKHKMLQKRWREENPEKAKISSSSWRLAHPEEFKLLSKAYKTKNKKHVMYLYSVWRQNNKKIRNLYLRNWVKQNKEKTKQFKRKDTLRKYGLSLEDFNNMLVSQGGVCKICGTDNKGRLLCVDHDHITGKVRALLCNNCNTGLGMLKDNILILEKALEYLKQHST